MRVFLKVEIPVKTGNSVARKGLLGETIQSILKEQKPEAVYFTEMNGNRTGLLFINLADASQIPALCEPWFLAFNAKVECRPVMTPEDLAKAAPSIEKAVKKYGKK